MASKIDSRGLTFRAADVEKIYPKKASGKAVWDVNRPQLERAIDALGTDDVLVVAEWHRATRSMRGGFKIMIRIADRGAAIKVLDKPVLDLTTPSGRGLLVFWSSLAEEERQRSCKGRLTAARLPRALTRHLTNFPA